MDEGFLEDYCEPIILLSNPNELQDGLGSISFEFRCLHIGQTHTQLRET